MKKTVKTNAMRILDTHHLSYKVHVYEHHANEAVDGIHVAQSLGQDPACVFKTLVTQANTKEYIVFMIPVNQELNLKACARQADVKNVEMIHVKDINKVTGYIRGGCSPIGMKKEYRTFIDQSALNQDHIYFSAGKIGAQIEMDPHEFISSFQVQPALLTK